MKKLKKVLPLLLLPFFLVGCQEISYLFKGFEQNFKGLDVVVQTYDTNSQLIDKVEGNSVLIERDSKFDSDNESSDSSVIKLTIGKNEIHHVGSSMIISEDGLENIFDDYIKQVGINTISRGVPIVNSMVNEFKNSFKGKEKVILIRSQHGTPLATYAGNNVSLFKTSVPKSTGLLIDGKLLFIYRSDFTIYDLELIEE